MERVIDVIVSCSNRKKYPVRRGLSLRQVVNHDISKRVHHWLSNLRKVNASEHPSEELYAGDHWSIVRAIASQSLNRRVRARVWICSAGYGLVPYRAPLKPYRATFASGHHDSVSLARSHKECSVENQRWWDALARSWEGPVPGKPRRLCDIPRACGKAPMLVALSSDYLTATSKDLGQLISDPYYRTHLHVISCGSQNPDATLSPNLLPCDASMQRAVGGARVSLNVRIAAYLLRQLKTGAEPHKVLRELCSDIKRKPLAQIKRTTVKDNDVKNFIRSEFRKNPRLSRTALLQLLRRKRFACEQSRFARLYRATVSSRPRSYYA
jgi:hypothetical protein